MEENIVIGIEGMVASGKTSICKELTNKIKNSIFIDGGSIYRGIVMAVYKSGIDISQMLNSTSIAEINALELMKKLQVDFKIENKETTIYIQGNKVDDNEIQSIQNAIGVSSMASKFDNTSFFAFAKNIIDNYRKQYNIIVSGRGIVSVYPNMTSHVYITASLDERIKRRYNQYNGQISEEEIKKVIVERDKMHEDAGYNKMFDRSISVDVTECKSATESANKVIEFLLENGYIDKEQLN